MNPQPIPPVPNLLLVDDSRANLELLSSVFKRYGFKVRPVPSGELALQAARYEPPDLILLDISMPGLDGYQVCERLKADPRLAPIPVIFISALDDPLDKVRAFGVGGVDYVTKPFHFEEVEARVRTHLTLHRQERQLQENLTRLQELERLRDSLVHMIVHDLRSPLTAVIMSLGLLREGAGSDPQAVDRLLRIASDAASGATAMVSQLLDISRLEAGSLPLSRGSNDLTAVLRTALELLEPTAGKRRLLLAPPAPLPATFDAEIIRRVAVNLLGNAIKFSPAEGEIRVVASMRDGNLRVEITDEGPGIDPRFHAQIFEKFRQVDGGEKRLGSGLGLTFCRLAVEAHGGRIGVRSTLGEGSTFWFTLPDRPAPVPDAPTAPPASVPAAGSGG